MFFNKPSPEQKHRELITYTITLNPNGSVLCDIMGVVAFTVSSLQASALLQILCGNESTGYHLNLSVVDLDDLGRSHQLRVEDQLLSFNAEQFEKFADAYVQAFTSLKRKAPALSDATTTKAR